MGIQKIQALPLRAPLISVGSDWQAQADYLLQRRLYLTFEKPSSSFRWVV